MLRKVLISTVLGAIMLFVWTFVANAVFLFNLRVNMKPVFDERRVYQVLKESIVAPGHYVCNPALTSSGIFPSGEPVFAIQYSGFGHEAAGWLQIVKLPVIFVMPLIASWMLAVSSQWILSSYFRRVLFLTAIGFLFAFSAYLTKFDIGGYPLHDTLLLAAYDVVTWLLLGFVVAWRITPAAGVVAHS